MINIVAVKTKRGYYITEQEHLIDRYKGLVCGVLFYDGIQPAKTFKDDWFFIEKEPINIKEEKTQPNINYRYELKDKSMLSDKIPLSFKRESVASPGEYTYSDWEWKEEFGHLRSLYELKSDEQPKLMVPLEFTWNVILDLPIDEINEPVKMSYNILGKRDWQNAIFNLENKDIQHQLLDRVIFPSIILHNTPANLTSKQSYDIVREYVREHIDGRYAKITSDYDFCFTVKKVLKIAKPYIKKIDTRLWGSKKRTPTIKEVAVESREVEIFEMTHSESKYSGYTVFSGFEASSEAELKMQIDAYLEDLMAKINEPLVECIHCNGKGVVLNEEAK